MNKIFPSSVYGIQMVTSALVMLISLSSSCAPKKSTTAIQLDRESACARSWTYVQLKEKLTGTIVFYEQPIVHCGVVSTASVALIRMRSGKFARVLTLCDIKKDFQAANKFLKGDSVEVMPSKNPQFRIDLMPTDPESCKFKTAYFGTITKTP